MEQGLVFIAGVLTIFAPCVLPLLPIIFGGTLSKNKLFPVYIIIGLILSFTTVGFLLSRYGSIAGLSSENIKLISGFLMLILGLSYIIKPLNEFIQIRLSKLTQLGHTTSLQLNEQHPVHAMALGSLLGLIWSPCSGPALGVAISLASQKEKEIQSLQMMFLFALGAGISLLFFSYSTLFFSQKIFINLTKVSEKFKNVFGYIIFVLSLVIIFNLDKKIEVQLLKILPEFMTELSTRF